MPRIGFQPITRYNLTKGQCRDLESNGMSLGCRRKLEYLAEAHALHANSTNAGQELPTSNPDDVRPRCYKKMREIPAVLNRRIHADLTRMAIIM